MKKPGNKNAFSLEPKVSRTGKSCLSKRGFKTASLINGKRGIIQSRSNAGL
jgi:hypothetical protein